MKTFYKILSCAAGALLLVTACNPALLDIPQQGVQNEENSYITDSDCEAAITAVYAAWRTAWSGSGDSVGKTYTCLFWLKNAMSDELMDPIYLDVANSAVTPSDVWVTGCYNLLWKTVYLANIVIDKFQPESDIKARCIAEAKFFRALCYYELITLWGTVPKVDHVLQTPDDYQVGPSTYEELWAMVETDLNDAIKSGKLGTKNSIDDKETGTRITQEAAYAVLGKVYLTEEKFTEAQTALGKVITSRKYGLIDNMNDLYHTEANGCREYLFENVRHDDPNNYYFRYEKNGEKKSDAGQDGWYGLQENWVICEGATVGQNSPFKFVTAYGWGSFSPTKKVYDAFVAEEGQQSKRRLASVIAIEDLPMFNTEFKLSYGWTYNEGFFRFKWLMSEDDEVAAAWTGRLNNTPCMRYADVLLMMAEACARGGGDPDPYINEVRRRAGLSQKQGCTLDDVKKERFLELCFEGVRFQDLKRWGDLPTELADKGKRIPSLVPGWTVIYKDNPDPAAGWQDRDYLLPFPLVELQTNAAMADHQNPGY